MTEEIDYDVDIYSLYAGGTEEAVDDSLSLSEWKTNFGAGISNEIDAVRGWSNYQRHYELDKGTLDGETEGLIRNITENKIKSIDPEYIIPEYAGTLDTDIGLVKTAFGS